MDNFPGDMSEMLGRLMADEKFGEMVQSIRSSLSADAENDPPEEDSAPAVEATSANTVPNIPPDLISKLPEIMGMLKSSEGGTKHGSRMDDRKRLLTAMKPFLSEKRRSAVDSIVNIAGIADIFGI